jgi:predicted nucleic acid-binding protein
MNVYFFDSSAIVKNYISEIGSNWVKNIFNTVSTDIIYAASITQVEVIAAFARKRKGLNLSARNAASAISQFKRDFLMDFREIELKPKIITQSVSLADRYSLRGYDAVQLASALEIYAHLVNLKVNFITSNFTFVSADDELNSAALAEHLTIENPNNYP